MMWCHLSDRAFGACLITLGLVAVVGRDDVGHSDQPAPLRPDVHLYLYWCQHHDRLADLDSAIPTCLGKMEKV